MSEQLSTASLKEYVALAYDMERSIYEQERALEFVERKIGQCNAHLKPVQPAAPAAHDKRGGGIPLIIIGAFVFEFAIESFWILALIGLGMAVVGIGKVVDDRKYNQRLEMESENAQKKYINDTENYNRAMKSYAADLAIADSLKKKLPQMKQRLSKNKTALTQFYSQNVIYYTYRNLVAVSSFNDYLMSGRCKSLEGHEGAYNIYSTESRLDRLITQMDEVIKRLKQIQHNQNSLYQVVQESNKKIDALQESVMQSTSYLNSIGDNMQKIYSGMEQLNCTIEIERFEQEQIRKEVEFRNRMDGYYRRISI